MDNVSTATVVAALRRAATALTVTGAILPGAVSSPATVVTRAAPDTGSVAGSGAQTRSSVGPTALPDVAGLRGTWEWPLQPRPDVLAPFAAPRATWGAGHRGIDLAAAPGQVVLSVDDGEVTHVGVIAGRGTVTVTHDSGLRSTYEPVAASVRRGDRVRARQEIGVVRVRTHCGAACLHLGALTGPSGTGYTDPRPLLGGGRVILLPQADR